MLSAYLPLFYFLALSTGIAIFVVLLSQILSRKKHINDPKWHQESEYECGFDAIDYDKNFRHPFNIHYFRIALLFLIFDLEIAFLFPWCYRLKENGVFGYGSVMLFLFILTVGFVYEWNQKALEWEL